MIVNDKRATIVHNFLSGHEYEVVVRALGPDNTSQAMEAAARNTIVIRGKLTAPAGATTLTANGGLNSISLSWTNPADYDFSLMRIYRSPTFNYESAALIAEVRGYTYLDWIGTANVTRYYWIEAVNTSGVESPLYPDEALPGVNATTIGIDATSIDDFSVTATKLFTNTVILSADAWTNNSPGAGSIAWNTHTIVHNGTSYPITAGNTALAYVYWVIGDTTYTDSATHPALGTTGFMIAINTSGTHTMVWNSSANMVIGSAFIMDLAVDKLVANSASTNEFVSNTAQIKNAIITNAKISTLDAAKITTGTLVIARTEAKNTDPLADQTGANTAKDIQYLPRTPAGAGLYCDATHIGYHSGAAWTSYIGSDGKFYFTGDGTNAIAWDGATLTVRGTLTADDIVAGGTITGSTFRTDTGGAGHYHRAVLSASDNTLRLYNAANTNVVTIDDGSNFGGNAPLIKLYEATYGGEIVIERGGGPYLQMHLLSPPFIDLCEGSYLGSFVRVKNLVDAGAYLYAGVDFNDILQFTVNDRGAITGESLRLHGVGGSYLWAKNSAGDTWYPLIYDGTTHAWQSSGVQKMALDVSGNLSLSGTVDGVDVAAHAAATTSVHGSDASGKYPSTPVLAGAEVAGAVATHAGLTTGIHGITSAIGTAAYAATGDFAPIGHVGAGGGAHADATTSVHGFMTDTQFDKLAGIAATADVTGDNPPQAHAHTHASTTGRTSDDHHAQSHNNTYHSTNYLVATHEGLGGSVHADVVAGTPGTDGFMTYGDKNKLNTVEDSADKTDATNVAGAGAIMDGDFGTNGFMKRAGAGSYTHQADGLDGAYSTSADWNLTFTNGLLTGASPA